MKFRPAYQDELTAKKKRAKRFKLGLILASTILCFGVMFYAVFFLDTFTARNIRITNSKHSDQFKVGDVVAVFWGQKKWGFLPLNKNIIFLRKKTLESRLLSEFPFLQNIVIDKELPHNLNISLVERIPLGFWCFREQCQYFDSAGFAWFEDENQPGLVRVHDDRNNRIDEYALSQAKNLLAHIPGLGVDMKDIFIQEQLPHDIKVTTAQGYALWFGYNSDIAKQSRILGVFLADKLDDAEFSPKYIDLRIDDRVYYK